ncbi:MAG: DMT family transporter [Sulfitobacter litoralis]|jgi:drug/metabolite transporter (DMT)-like permease|uniref:DMT family transporter n=2 Tax=root TaxID=1 RepID=A0A7V1BCK9_9RHOB|nr:DMT family transporter [Sulfitobacter litoralis]MCF7725938.1 EamA family transporter [Sulfitobacter sp. M22]MCF7777264.1 EamA family transporter [Sulfitobacter sp. M220]MBQ0802282.1 DMT family transporter [Sulfitobacter litoralis]HDY94370.1 DMT family transporter [Sulfitobacter litoralis]|tara:strand:- start:196 stop:1029 length:834 start_codon:yes stop_codon:yes gene_type:complete
MMGSITSFSAMAVAGRELGGHLDTFEIMMYRSLVGVITVVTLASLYGTWGQINRRNFGIQIGRNLAHFTGQNLWFYAVTVIPLAQVFALEFTSPLWVIVLSPFILGERLTKVRALAAVLGFVGILCVARPTIAGLNAGVITAASSAIFFALTIMLTKRLTRSQTITCILFYLTVTQLVFGVVMAGYDGEIAVPDTAQMPLLLLIGIAGLLAHFCLTNALSIAPATVVVPIDFIRLPLIAVIGMLVYAEALDIWVFIGGAIIFAGNYLNLWVEARRVA